MKRLGLVALLCISLMGASACSESGELVLVFPSEADKATARTVSIWVFQSRPSEDRCGDFLAEGAAKLLPDGDHGLALEGGRRNYPIDQLAPVPISFGPRTVLVKIYDNDAPTTSAPFLEGCLTKESPGTFRIALQPRASATDMGADMTDVVTPDMATPSPRLLSIRVQELRNGARHLSGQISLRDGSGAAVGAAITFTDKTNSDEAASFDVTGVQGPFDVTVRATDVTPTAYVGGTTLVDVDDASMTSGTIVIKVPIELDAPATGTTFNVTLPGGATYGRLYAVPGYSLSSDAPLQTAAVGGGTTTSFTGANVNYTVAARDTGSANLALASGALSPINTTSTSLSSMLTLSFDSTAFSGATNPKYAIRVKTNTTPAVPLTYFAGGSSFLGDISGGVTESVPNNPAVFQLLPEMSVTKNAVISLVAHSFQSEARAIVSTVPATAPLAVPQPMTATISAAQPTFTVGLETIFSEANFLHLRIANNAGEIIWHVVTRSSAATATLTLSDLSTLVPLATGMYSLTAEAGQSSVSAGALGGQLISDWSELIRWGFPILKLARDTQSFSIP